MNLRIAGIEDESIVDGPGYRYAIFTQGCPHACPACHNPKTHDKNAGKDVETDALFAAILDNPLLSGVTFSGGEPFLQPAPLAELATKIREDTPSLDIWCYTGYTYEELTRQDNIDVQRLLSLIDVLVDGRFIVSERDLTLDFRGSRNQRLIDVPQTRRAGHVVLHTLSEHKE